MSNKSKKEKIMLGLSFSFLVAAGLILGVKALTIGTAIINTQQIIDHITVTKNHSLNLDDIMIDLNMDGNGTAYFKNKVGIGTRTPQSALQVSGTIRTNQICTQDGASCLDIANINTDSSKTTITYNGGDGYLESVSLNNNILSFNVSGHTVNTIDLSGYITNTSTSTSLSLSGNLLSISGDTTSIDLSGYLPLTETGVDNYVANNGYLTGVLLYLSGNLLSISGNTTSIDLSGYLPLTETGIDNYVANNGYLTGNITTNKIPYYSGSGLIESNITYDGTNIGIGETNPSQKLEVNGTILATSFVYSSDRRLKTNIKKIDHALDKIRKLNAYSFNWKKNGTPSMGFIAQELQKEYPLFVHKGTNNYLSVDYSSMTIPLLQAVKELDAENQKLKGELSELKQRLESLEYLIK